MTRHDSPGEREEISTTRICLVIISYEVISSFGNKIKSKNVISTQLDEHSKI